MPYFRVSYEGYIEGEYDNEEEAIKEFLEGLNEDYVDAYGRTREQMLRVEKFNEEKGEWE